VEDWSTESSASITERHPREFFFQSLPFGSVSTFRKSLHEGKETLLLGFFGLKAGLDQIDEHTIGARLSRLGQRAWRYRSQNSFVERLIGSVRRECLDHVLVLNERHLRRILTRYFAYYHRARTHLSLAKDAPDTRPIARPAFYRIIQIPEVGVLHHRYERRAA